MPLKFYDIYCRHTEICITANASKQYNARRNKKNISYVCELKKKIERPKSTQFQMQSI